ncbi:hypothetical protein [Edaphobacter modestus]|nr:hypothetical protein [Edaphobacter modestus]
MALAMHIIQIPQERGFSNSATDDELPKKHNEWPCIFQSILLAHSLRLALFMRPLSLAVHDLVSVSCDCAERNGPPMLRIEKELDGHTTTLRLIGRIQSADIGSIQAQMDDDSVHVLFDLGEVTLVNVEVIRFLSDCEDEGVVLIHCPPYVREWILRERDERSGPRIPDGT